MSFKVAVVTGGSRGIGRAIVERLHAKHGAKVVVNYRSSKQEAEELAASLGDDVVAIQGDVSKRDDCEKLVAATIERFGRLDYLINNAGWTRKTPHDNLDLLNDELIETTLDVNLKGPIRMVKAAMPHLQKSDIACVINITSVAGIAANGSSSIYCASKAALSTMTRAWARAFAPHVRFNAVAPGFVDTGFMVPKGSAVADNALKRVHIGRNVEPKDIADAVDYLLISAVTGEELVVDGGKISLGSRDAK